MRASSHQIVCRILPLALFVVLQAFTSINVVFEVIDDTGSLQGNQTTFPTTAKNTALLMRTVAPLRPPVLGKIYKLATELQESNAPYDFWLQVDETPQNGSEQVLRDFFQKHGGAVEPPRVFVVSEAILLQQYPRLTSYIHNAPEPNFHNATGLCCEAPIMWQMFIPTAGMFLAHHVQQQPQHRHGKPYEYAWCFEDDVGAIGERSLIDLIRLWDSLLDPSVDLVATKLLHEHWGRPRHTMNMERIVQAMQDANVSWAMYSDTIQRHSLALAKSIVTEVTDNVMQFGERLIHPIAWKHNRSIVDLDSFSKNHAIFGLADITGAGKLTNNQAIEKFISLKTQPATLLYHEELSQIPGKRK